jgi:hypothetical protein
MAAYRKSIDGLDWESRSGSVGAPRGKINHEVIVIDNRAVKLHEVIVHQFKMGDVEDPILYASQPLYEWEHSEEGQWIMSHAVESPVWHRHADPFNYGYNFAITAKLKERDYTHWLVKWKKLST